MTIGNGPSGGLDSGSLAGVRWTDKSFPLTRDKQGQTEKPDYDFVNRGLLFPNNNAAELVQILDQMDHRKKLGSAIRLHIHFIQTSALVPIFEVNYKFWNEGGAVPGSNTLISTDDGDGPLFTYPGSGSILQIIRFPEIPAPAGELVSAHLEFDLWRNDAIVAGDVLTKYIDYHYQQDSDGSREEFSK